MACISNYVEIVVPTIFCNRLIFLGNGIVASLPNDKICVFSMLYDLYLAILVNSYSKYHSKPGYS